MLAPAQNCKGVADMKLNVILKKVSLRDKTREHIEAKLNKLERFFRDPSAGLMVKSFKDQVIVELTIKDGGMIYRAQDTGADVSDSFDRTVDIIIRQIRKNKTRLEKRLRSTSFEEAFPVEPIEEEREFKVVKNKRFEVKPLSVEEAILQMEQIGHQFYMFMNDETDQINVVYRRNDGDYGLIEPEGR